MIIIIFKYNVVENIFNLTENINCFMIKINAEKYFETLDIKLNK